VEAAVDASAAVGGGPLVVAGAGYAGLHAVLRLTARLRGNPETELVLVDRHDYHQVLTELPRVAGGTRAAGAVRIPLPDMLADRVSFVQAEINGFDLAGRRLLTAGGPIGWRRLVLALGSRPNDFAIPGLAQRALSLYSASDAERVWAAVNERGRAGRRAGRGAARGGQPSRPGAWPARRAASRGGSHHLGGLLTPADRQGHPDPR
jgi:NADH dehydrogenase FAD-containing subunit